MRSSVLVTLRVLAFGAAILAGIALTLVMVGPADAFDGRPSPATFTNPPADLSAPAPVGSGTYSQGELVDAGHSFFGQTSGGLASVIEAALSRFGEPNGYILGEEGAASFVGGVRYGEGALFTRILGTHTVFWQGPSLGWDFGGAGSRVMMLVYDLPDVPTLMQRYTGVEGSAYAVAGLSMTVMAADNTFIVPVRTGVGIKLGLNVGYLKFTANPTWNPF